MGLILIQDLTNTESNYLWNNQLNFLFSPRFYLFRQRSQVGRGKAQREEEAGAPLCRDPDAGLDPRILGSWHEPKAQVLTHWATQAPQSAKSELWLDMSWYCEIILKCLKSEYSFAVISMCVSIKGSFAP